MEKFARLKENKSMQSIDYRTAMLTHIGLETAQNQSLAKLARRWDGGIRRELRRFAQYLWPDIHLLGLVPIHSYRLREHLQSGKVVWWVERDIPPFDRYLCEAYSVELSLADSNQPRLMVRSGVYAYPVAPISLEGLKAVLVRAGADTPLVIPRQFGSALDP